MSFLRLETIILDDGGRIPLTPDSIVVFVGANNAGKSVALKAIDTLLSSPSTPFKSVIVGLEIARLASLDELTDLMKSYRSPHSPDTYIVRKTSFPKGALAHYWRPDGDSIGPLSGVAVTMLSTEARLGDCAPPPNIDLTTSRPDHPFQQMLADRDLENTISEVVRKAFKCDLVIDRGAGGVIPAYIGTRPKLKKGEERGDLSYTLRVRELSPLQEQGDGMRSFVSIVARVMGEARPIFLIDEPEAFLHPPQARLVARHLVADRKDCCQTFLSTHSSDVLQGLFSLQKPAPITVVRLSRSGGKATAVILDPARVVELWKDPILRFSNILDGLFHDGVVVTESDADCRFYEAIVDVSTAPESRPDLHYCYSGGKDRLHVVIQSLAQLGLPVAIVVDFDVLNNELTLKRILEAAGGSWAEVEKDWKIVKIAVEAKSGFLAADAFKSAVNVQLKLCKQGEAVPRDVLSNVKKLTRQASPWDFCKSAGMRGVPKGAPTIAATRLLNNLKKSGIFVVPVGEIEGFKPSIGVHGPRWVEEALRADISCDPELAEARAFASEVVAHFK